MKPNSKYNFLGYLKQVYGRLPLEPFISGSERENALDIGTFSIEVNTLLQAARDNNDVCDYLIHWYNQESYQGKARIDTLRQSLPKSIRWRFSYELSEKEKNFKFILTISQLRLRYMSHIPTDDEKKLSLSQINAKIAIHKAEFLETKFDPEVFFFSKGGFKALFPFGNRQRNVQILGGAGSGKSELIKLFLYDDIQSRKGCFLLDPHGDLASEVAHFKAEKGRILYLSPEFGSKLGYYFRFNPLQHRYYDSPTPIKAAFISVKAQELLSAFSIIMSQEFSPNMERIISNCMQVLLTHKGMNLRDFLHFLRPATSESYEQLGREHYSESVRLFFQHEFNQKRLEITRASILTRFENALSNYHIAKIFDCKESSFDFQKALNQGKCLLFNLSQGKLGESGSRMLGSFIIAELTTLALQKEKIPVQYRKPWMGYIDECQNYLTERIDKILSEARKYAVHLTLANQFLGQVQNPRLKDSMLANTNIKCLGFSSYKDYEKMSKEMNFKGKQTPKLGKGRFIVKVGSHDPIVIQAYDFLIGKKGACYITQEQHYKRLNHNLQNYYTKTIESQKIETSDVSKAENPKTELPKIEDIL